jgi:hypothetical protein
MVVSFAVVSRPQRSEEHAVLGPLPLPAMIALGVAGRDRARAGDRQDGDAQ